MTQQISNLTEQVQTHLLLATYCKENAWIKSNFLNLIATLFAHIYPQQNERDNFNFNIDTLQKAMLISQGSLKCISVPRPDTEPLIWDITQNKKTHQNSSRAL